MKNFESSSPLSLTAEDAYPLPLSGTSYGDYRQSTYQQKIEKLDWISRTIKYVSSGPNRVILPRTFQDIVQYASEAFWSCSHGEASPQNMQIARQLNNLLGGLTEYSHRSADLTVEQINSPNYDTAKASAVRLMPDDINFYWGNHHVTFNEFLTNNPISNDFLITRKLFGGSHNYLPASLEQFCIDFNDSKIDSRLASNIEAMGISVGVNGDTIYMQYEDKKLMPLSFYK